MSDKSKLPGDEPLKPDSQAISNEIIYSMKLKNDIFIAKTKLKPKTTGKWTTRRFN